MTEYEKAVERRARAMHDAYEAAAMLQGWETQKICRVPFDELPEANKRTMYATARATLRADDEAGYALVKKEATAVMVETGRFATVPHRVGGDTLWRRKINAAIAKGEIKPED